MILIDFDFDHATHFSEIAQIAAEMTLQNLQLDECEVSILLTDDDRIQKLNCDYRGLDQPTDVLAFAMRDGDDAQINRDLLGDVVVSIETAHRNAIAENRPIENEIALLITHGVLHLIGFDHESSSDAAVMFEKQKIICDQINKKISIHR